MNVTSVDICCGLNWGDEAKGKVKSVNEIWDLLEEKPEITLYGKSVICRKISKFFKS